MAKKRYEAQLEELDKLRNDPAAATALPKYLRDKSNYTVSKAAKIAADLSLVGLMPDLLAALDRFYDDEDKQCWAKNALIDAVHALGHTESPTFLRGLRHVQMEPVWGKSVDTAGPLRARCAVALPECRDLRDVEVLRHLLESLVDAEKTVRAEAARAIGRIPRDEAALLLRLRLLQGDEEPEVLGACFSALLGIENAGGISFVERFLERDEQTAGEAAIALGLTHQAEAFAILKRAWEQNRRRVQLAAVILTAMALTNLPEAIDFLMERVEAGSKDAVKALGSARLSDTDRERLQAVLEGS